MEERPTGPDPDETHDVTMLLGRVQEGDADAEEALIPLIYGELYRIAKSQMAGQPAGHTLGATGLVHEAYMRMAGQEGQVWESRRHFLRVAAKAMRSALVDHARKKRTQKRGGDSKATPLDDLCLQYEERSLDLLALDEALVNLAKKDEQLAKIVELRFFAGLENARIAEVIGCSDRTVERGWATARAWLSLAMGGTSGLD